MTQQQATNTTPAPLPELEIIEAEKRVTVKTIEWYDDRYYKVALSNGDNDYLESVTTVLGVVNNPFFSHMRGEVGNELADQKMNDAARKGTAIHHACAVLAQGGRVEWINPEFGEDIEHEKVIAQMKYFNGSSFFVFRREQEDWLHVVRFYQWWNALKPNLLFAEKNVYSIKEHCAGTLDYAVEVKEGDYQISGEKPVHLEGGIYIVDLKTGKIIDDNYFLQISAYANMANLQIIGGLLLHTNAAIRSGIEGVKTYVRTREQLAIDFKDFQAVHTVWKRRNETQKPKVMELPTYLSFSQFGKEK